MTGGADPRPAGSASLAPPRALLVVACAWLAVLVLAPPDSNLAWAVDGLRSIPPLAALGLAVTGALFAALARWTRVPLWALAAVLALALAFPLRERVHLLGDTAVRLRLLDTLAGQGTGFWNLAGFARVLHAQPLDGLVDVSGVLLLTRLGVPVATAVAWLEVALLLACAAGLERAVARTAPPALRVPLTLALLVGGTLQVYARYADGWALTLALGAWWWAALAGPLARRRDAVVAAALWLALFLSHRLALALLVAQAWRGFGPALAGDAPAARRLHRALTGAVALAAAAIAWRTGGRELGGDLRDLARSLADPRTLRLTPAWDVAGLVALTAPLAVLAPVAAGRAACASFARSPRGALALATLLPLLPMLLVFPVAPHGLGAQRDWDLMALPGMLAGAAAVALLSCAPPARVRAALTVILPLVVLQTGGWIAVNADARAGERRALAIAEGPFAPPAEQRNQALVFLAYRAADARDYATAARRFERACEVLPNPRHLLLASQSWLVAGDLGSARRCLAAALAMGPLPPDVADAAATVESMVRAAEAGGGPAGGR